MNGQGGHSFICVNLIILPTRFNFFTCYKSLEFALHCIKIFHGEIELPDVGTTDSTFEIWLKLKPQLKNMEFEEWEQKQRKYLHAQPYTNRLTP